MTAWRKSSHSFSNGNCAEVTGWRKSTASMSNGHCAEVANGIAVRDSKDPDGPVLTFTPGQWKAFTGSIQAMR